MHIKEDQMSELGKKIWAGEYWNGALKESRKLFWRSLMKKGKRISAFVALLSAYYSASGRAKKELERATLKKEKDLWQNRYIICGAITAFLAQVIYLFIPIEKLSAEQCDVVGTVFLKTDKAKIALKYFVAGDHKAYSTLTQVHTKALIVLGIMEACFKLGEPERAEKFYNEALRLSNEYFSDANQLIRVFKKLAEYENKTDRTGEANYHYTLARELADLPGCEDQKSKL
ncbi:hypothetical protein HY249_01620 [Candidatus Azambacteria bacterium]|nr:hypothetical protein [Candidatus Azambacteria bacterium]